MIIILKAILSVVQNENLSLIVIIFSIIALWAIQIEFL